MLAAIWQPVLTPCQFHIEKTELSGPNKFQSICLPLNIALAFITAAMPQNSGQPRRSARSCKRRPSAVPKRVATLPCLTFPSDKLSPRDQDVAAIVVFSFVKVKSFLNHSFIDKMPTRNFTDDGSLGFPKMLDSQYCIASSTSAGGKASVDTHGKQAALNSTILIQVIQVQDLNVRQAGKKIDVSNWRLLPNAPCLWTLSIHVSISSRSFTRYGNLWKFMEIPAGSNAKVFQMTNFCNSGTKMKNPNFPSLPLTCSLPWLRIFRQIT